MDCRKCRYDTDLCRFDSACQRDYHKTCERQKKGKILLRLQLCPLCHGGRLPQRIAKTENHPGQIKSWAGTKAAPAGAKSRLRRESGNRRAGRSSEIKDLPSHPVFPGKGGIFPGKTPDREPTPAALAAALRLSGTRTLKKGKTAKPDKKSLPRQSRNLCHGRNFCIMPRLLYGADLPPGKSVKGSAPVQRKPKSNRCCTAR